MSRFGTQYHIGRFTGVCAATGEPLAPGSPCIAALCDHADTDGFERRDYSVEAWEAGSRPDRLFSFWRTVVPEPNARRKLLVDDEVLLDLFERLADDERPHRVAFRFILALILMRKKQLRFVRRAEAGSDRPPRWLLRPRGTEPDAPPLEVIDPELSDDDVRELTAQLGEILQGEL